MKSDIDLHIHTNASDGTVSVRGLIEFVRKAGVKTFSITDHDTLSGTKEAQSLGHSSNLLRDLTFFPGVEISCKYKDINLHLLGLGLDCQKKCICDLLAQAQENRRKKSLKLVRYLKEKFGIFISELELEEMFKRKQNLGKPDFVPLIIEKGGAENAKEAYEKYLDDFSDSEYKIDVSDAIAAIKGAHGFSVLAHPLIITEDFGYSYEDIDRLVGEICDFGLDGLEVYYGKHSIEDKTEYEKIAKKYHLLMSGGSDFHGDNKPNIKIGDLGDGIDEKAYGHMCEFILEMMQ